MKILIIALFILELIAVDILLKTAQGECWRLLNSGKGDCWQCWIDGIIAGGDYEN